MVTKWLENVLRKKRICLAKLQCFLIFMDIFHFFARMHQCCLLLVAGLLYVGKMLSVPTNIKSAAFNSLGTNRKICTNGSIIIEYIWKHCDKWRNWLFLLLSLCFQKLSVMEASKCICMWERESPHYVSYASYNSFIFPFQNSRLLNNGDKKTYFWDISDNEKVYWPNGLGEQYKCGCALTKMCAKSMYM